MKPDLARGTDKVFLAIAERLQAGEEYWSVLRDYNIVFDCAPRPIVARLHALRDRIQALDATPQYGVTAHQAEWMSLAREAVGLASELVGNPA